MLGPHENSVEGVAFSPDGKRIASKTYGTLRLWDGESGKIVSVLRDHTAAIALFIFSPDGSRLISSGKYPENEAHLWDAATGRLLATLSGHRNEILAVAFSPDGKRVATGSVDQSARLWDGYTGQLLAVLAGHTGQVQHILFSPNGTRVATASDDATIRLWDAQTGEAIGVLCEHGVGVDWNCPPVFTPDGSKLVSNSSGDGTLRVWDLNQIERNILRGHKSFVYDVAFNPNGEQVASAAWDGTASLGTPRPAGKRAN